MSRPSVLIITYGFPPHIKSLGGAIRMLKLAEYLQNRGCKVHVLCARTAHHDTFGYDALLASLTVTYVDDPVAVAGARVFKHAARSADTAAPANAGIKARLKRLVIDALTPDTAMLTVRRMERAAMALLGAEPAMTVITSGPPHSMHLVGYRLKKQVPAIQWIVDYRDSWNGSSLFRKRHALLQRLNEFFERRVLARCDQFTYISAPMIGKASRLGGAQLPGKARLVANGFDLALLDTLPRARPQPGPLRVGYFGAIDNAPNSYRNPEALFEVVRQRPELDIRIELYGSINISSDWQEKLGARLMIGPRLSHQEALNTMAGMDALLLLHTRADGADEVVTGKVFEYVATARPIISIGPKAMAVNDLLAGDPSFFQAEHTSAGDMEAVLTKLARAKSNGTLCLRERDRLASFSREGQFASFLEMVGNRLPAAHGE